MFRKTLTVFPHLVVPFLMMILVACATGKEPSSGVTTAGEPSFESPEAAVPQISEMLQNKEWKRLAAYYDLSNSQVKREELESGRYFMAADTNARELPPPEKELAKYSHPFHPKFRFMRTEPTDREGVVRVELVLEIEQGGDMPPRRTIDQFFMRKSAGGYRILPGDGK